MKHFVSALATIAFIFPVTVMPNAVENCGNANWTFTANVPTQQEAADYARDEFCRVVNDYVNIYQ